MSDRKPLMPKATAVWLVDNTSLTFDQIAEFCDLHVLEVKGIADGDVAQGIRGLDPISRGQITRAEIERGEKDSSHKLRVAEAGVKIPEVRRKRYTPVSLRQEKPNAVLWLLRNHPELKDSQIIRLIGTTKQTIGQIRDRSHWNSPNLQPNDPVTLGICTQVDLDAEVMKAARRLERERKASGEPEEKSDSLLPTEQTTTAMPTAQILARDTPEHTESEAEEEARVFARLKQMSGPKDEDLEGDDSQTDAETDSEATAADTTETVETTSQASDTESDAETESSEPDDAQEDAEQEDAEQEKGES
ncbi:MAG: cell cycle transcriptional regulator TrcR [Hyphomicrobiaceae bacterium]